LISTTHTRAKARRPNIRLTGNPRLAWFLQHLLSRNHDRPDYPVEAIVRFLFFP
jgi:hypothetical protein